MENKTNITVSKEDLPDTLEKVKGKENVNIMVTDAINEVDAVIEPKDPETIKYLSNVIDSRTGEISKPFNISGKQYQMVRGVTPNQEVVMSVYCHDEYDDSGDNKIYSVQYFEENVAKPAKDLIEGELIKQEEKQTGSDSLNLNEFKHFIVNENGKIRKFRTVEELAKANMKENEKYMGLSEFKKYVYERLFGQKPKRENKIIKVKDLNDE
jgi:hypothetical protein